MFTANDINAALIARMGLDTSDYDKSLRGTVQSADRAGRSMSVSFGDAALAVAKVTVAVATATTAVGLLASRGNDYATTMAEFNLRTGGGVARIEELRASTHGLVSDLKLMMEENKRLAKSTGDLAVFVADAGSAWKQFVTELSNTGDTIALRVSESDALATSLSGLTAGLVSVRDHWGFLMEAVKSGSSHPAFQALLDLLGAGAPSGRNQIAQLPGLSVTVPGGGFDAMRNRRRSMIPLTGPSSGPRIGSPFAPDVIRGGPPIDPSAVTPFTDLQPLGMANAEGKLQGLARADAFRRLQEETEKWRQRIQAVATTIETVLVRSLTRAIMQFESISKLIKDIGRSLLSGVVGGLVNFGVGALTNAILPGAGPAVAAATGVSDVAGGSSSYMKLHIDSRSIPEPTDFGIIATKPDVQRLVVEVIRNAQRNGATI